MISSLYHSKFCLSFHIHRELEFRVYELSYQLFIAWFTCMWHTQNAVTNESICLILAKRAVFHVIFHFHKFNTIIALFSFPRALSLPIDLMSKIEIHRMEIISGRLESIQNHKLNPFGVLKHGIHGMCCEHRIGVVDFIINLWKRFFHMISDCWLAFWSRRLFKKINSGHEEEIFNSRKSLFSFVVFSADFVQILHVYRHFQRRFIARWEWKCDVFFFFFLFFSSIFFFLLFHRKKFKALFRAYFEDNWIITSHKLFTSQLYHRIQLLELRNYGISKIIK